MGSKVRKYSAHVSDRFSNGKPSHKKNSDDAPHLSGYPRNQWNFRAPRLCIPVHSPERHASADNSLISDFERPWETRMKLSKFGVFTFVDGLPAQDAAAFAKRLEGFGSLPGHVETDSP
jgi:hypothetical protein